MSDTTAPARPQPLPSATRLRLARARAVTFAAEQAEAWLRVAATGMSRHDAAQWASARSLTDLGELNVRWLHGEIRQTPGHGGPPCAETMPVLTLLAEVNRAGFVTENSQYGGFDDPDNCADVRGFVSDAGLPRLRAEAEAAGLVFVACRGRVHGPHWHAWISAVGCPRTGVDHFYAGACPGVAAEIRAAWYVVIADPEPGRNDRLWPVLERFAQGG